MARVAADVMSTNFIFVDCDVTVAEAEELFEQIGVPALPVLNPDRTVFGLLTPQNLASFYKRPLNNPRAFHAWEICEARPLTANPNTPVQAIAESVVDGTTSHVLIVNAHRELIGVVSAEQLLAQVWPSVPLAQGTTSSLSHSPSRRH